MSHMSHSDFLRRLEELLDMDADSLTGAERLENLERWDSIAVMGFLALVDEQCGVALSPKTVAECGTVDELCAAALNGITSTETA